MVLLGILQIALVYGLVFWGEQYISSGLTAVLSATLPFFVVIYAHFLIKTESIMHRKIIILIRLHPKPIKEFVKDIQCPELQDPRVLSLHTVAHQYNLALFGIWESKEEYGKWKTRLLTRLDSVLETNELFILDSYKESDDPIIRIPVHIQHEIDEARISRN